MKNKIYNIGSFGELLVQLKRDNKLSHELIYELVEYYQILKDVNSLTNSIQKDKTLKSAKETAFLMHTIIEGLNPINAMKD